MSQRRALGLAILAYLILVGGFVTAVILLENQADRIDRHQAVLEVQQKQIVRNQKAIQHQQKQITRNQHASQHNTRALAIIVGTYGFRLCQSINEARAQQGLPPSPKDCEADRRKALRLIGGG